MLERTRIPRHPFFNSAMSRVNTEIAQQHVTFACNKNMGQSAGRICTGQIKAHIPPTMSAQGNTIIKG